MIERDKSGHFDKDVKQRRKKFGSLVNSFYELEPTYADYVRKEMRKKALLVGLASYNTNITNKADFFFFRRNMGRGGQLELASSTWADHSDTLPTRPGPTIAGDLDKPSDKAEK